MTTNISSLQSELLRLLNANGDITKMEYEDAISYERINGKESNMDLKGGDDLKEMVDNMLGGNANANGDALMTNDKNPKEIISDMLLDSKEDDDKSNDKEVSEIIKDIYEDKDDNITGGTKQSKKKNTAVKPNKEDPNDETTKPDNKESSSSSSSSSSESSSSSSDSDMSDDEQDNINSSESEEEDENNQKPEANSITIDGPENDYSDYSSSYSDSDYDEANTNLSSKYISIINEFKSKPVKMTGGLVGGSANSDGRVKIIPMFPYVIKQ